MLWLAVAALVPIFAIAGCWAVRPGRSWDRTMRQWNGRR
jgi:hypothetical protein